MLNVMQFRKIISHIDNYVLSVKECVKESLTNKKANTGNGDVIVYIQQP